MPEHRLIEIEFPEFGGPAGPPARPGAEHYLGRLEQVREAMERHGLTHLAVYGDREHFASLLWLTGFDPRFEEALLLVGPGAKPLLLAGNECMGYLPVSPLVGGGHVRTERYQPFSLPDQPRGESRTLAAILQDEGVDAKSRVGLAGWKCYATPQELDAPSYLADALRREAGYEQVSNAAGLMTGLRVMASPYEIAYFEWTNVLASEGMKRILENLRPGLTDHELLEYARYNGVPQSIYMTLKCGENRVSLASARGETLRVGDRFSCGIGYRGANCCRAGWAVEEASQEYLDRLAFPYFGAMRRWFGRLRDGVRGGELYEAIPCAELGVYLNPGHLIHYDEWPASPVYEGSGEILRSGMLVQSDVIPGMPEIGSARMEDTYALADSELQAQLDPELLRRARARRKFMAATLGIELHDSVLPLSNLSGVMPAAYLKPHTVVAVA